MKFIDILKNISGGDYYEKANFHIHTNASDGSLSPAEVIQKAENADLKYISITDHNTLEAYKSISVNIESLKIFTGIEFDCWYKTNFLHVLGYDFDLDNEKLINLCALKKRETELDIFRFFSKRKAVEVIKTIKEAGGVAVLAHPCCCWNLNLKKMIYELKQEGLDGVEVYYPYVGHRNIVKFHSVENVEAIARDLNMFITGGTDCHSDNIKGR